MAAAPTPEHAMESALPTDAAPSGFLQPPAAVAAEPQLLQGTLIGPSSCLWACSFLLPALYWACFFNTLYFQVTALDKLRTTTTQDLLAPHDPLGTLYDLIDTRAPVISEIGSQISHLLSRHWNNMSYSMEALSLLMIARGDPATIVTQAWLIMQLQHIKGPYPWKAQWLTPFLSLPPRCFSLSLHVAVPYISSSAITSSPVCARPPLGFELTTLATTITYVTITYVTPDDAPSRRMTTQKTTTTYVIKYSSYAPRGERQGLTVVRSRCSSIGHCEGAAKAVRAVRAATALSPVASLSHLFQSSRLLFRVFGGFLVHRRPLYSSHPTVHLETSAPLSAARVTFFRFYWWLK